MDEISEILKNIIEYLNLEKIEDEASLNKIIKILKENLNFVRVNKRRVPIESTELFYKFYDFIYKTIKAELLYNLKSELLKELEVGSTDEKGLLNLFIKNNFEFLLGNGNLSEEEFNILNSKYIECCDDNSFIDISNIILVTYFENKQMVSNVLRSHFNKISQSIKLSGQNIDDVCNEFDENKGEINSLLKKLRRAKLQNKYNIYKRVSALALSLAILAGGVKLSLDKAKKWTTSNLYPAIIDSITVDSEGKMIDKTHKEVFLTISNKELINLFSSFIDEEASTYYRYRMDDSAPYIEGATLEDNIYINSKILPSLLKKSELCLVLGYPSEDATYYFRDIITYDQGARSPYLKEDMFVRYWASVYILAIASYVALKAPWFPVDNIKKLIKLLKERKLNKENYETVVNELGAMLNNLEKAGADIADARVIYNCLLSLAEMVKIDSSFMGKISESELNAYSLKLARVKKEIEYMK